MKLTHRSFRNDRAASDTEPRAAFYRELGDKTRVQKKDGGWLYHYWRDGRQTKKHEDITENTVTQLDFERSFMGKLRPEAKAGKKYNQACEAFLRQLVSKNGNVPEEIPQIPAECWEKYLSPYGKRFRAYAGQRTLAQLFADAEKSPDAQEGLRKSFLEVRKAIQKRMEDQKKGLTDSIHKNTIPFAVDDSGEKLTAESPKMKWLYGFVTGSDSRSFDESRLTEYWENYGLEALHCELDKLSLPAVKKGRPDGCETARLVMKAVHAHHHNRVVAYGEEHSDEGQRKEFRFFLDVAEAHFHRYFPVKRKNGSEARQKTLTEGKTLRWYYSESFVKKEVCARILNRLVAGLIQQGKLYHYFYSHKDKKLDRERLNSDGLSYIQVEEAFKKQFLNSQTWAIARLNYLFGYELFGQDKKLSGVNPEDKEDIACYEGDIFMEWTSFDKARKEKSIQETVIDAKNKDKKTYLDAFFGRLFGHDGKERKNQIQKLREKLAETFPVEPEACVGCLIKMMRETSYALYHIRNNSFHFKMEDMLTALQSYGNKNGQPPLKVLPEMLERDIANIQPAFREQIRSYGITEYFPADLLWKSLKNLDFRLYADTSSLIPSFRKLYKKGSNLYRSESSDHMGLHWFRPSDEKQTQGEYGTGEENNGWRAYKNLLQLIYYYAFLPAVGTPEQEHLLTDYINSTKRWNREHTKKGAEGVYRYADMPDYHNEGLRKYAENLQREQMRRESLNHDGAPVSNYYVDFMQDVTVRAFDAYLEEALPQALKEHCAQSEWTKQDCDAKTGTDRLFELAKDNNQKGLTLHCSLKKRPDGLEVLYPLLRLLDAHELNRLRHQFTRYRTSLTKRVRLPNEEDAESLDGKLRAMEELMLLVDLTRPEAVGEVVFKESALPQFQDFMEKDMELYTGLYLQEDGLTPVQRRHMLRLARSGSLPLYHRVFENEYQVTAAKYEELKEWSLLGQPDRGQKSSTAGQLQRQLKELHEELAPLTPKREQVWKGKRKVAECRLEENTEKKVQCYRDILEQLTKYQALRGKLTFETMYTLHRIHVDLLGRFAAFAEDWERDMFFLLLGMRQNDWLEKKGIEEIFEQGSVVSNISSGLSGNDIALLYQLCWHEKGSKKKFKAQAGIRNSLAHLNHFTQYAKGISQPSLEQVIYKLHMLFAYDCKRQNSVTRTVKELLSTQYGLEISWVREKGEKDGVPKLKIASVCPKPIYHLKKLIPPHKKMPVRSRPGEKVRYIEAVSVLAQSEDLVTMVDRLFRFSYNEEKTGANPKQT